MKLRKALDEKLMDVRLRDRFVADGKVNQGQVESFLKNLQDDSGNMEQVEQKETAQATPTDETTQSPE